MTTGASKVAEVARITGNGDPLKLIGLKDGRRQQRKQTCPACGETKSVSGFNKMGRDNYNDICRSCEIKSIDEPEGIDGLVRALGVEIEACENDDARGFLRSALENVLMANVKLQVAKL